MFIATLALTPVGLAQLESSPGPVVPATSNPVWIQDLRTHLEQLEEAGSFSGVVLVAQDGTVVFETALGVASPTGARIESETRFPLASTSKMFTAVAIAQLVEAGALDPSDLVSTHLPSYPAHLIEGVTIHHLLSHTSGLGSFDFAQIQPMRTVDQMLDLDVTRTKYDPGERFEYSNMGYVLLGAIIERLSGSPFDTYLDTHVFAPLGMHDSGAFDLTTEVEGVAVGFTHLLDWSFRSDRTSLRVNDDFRVAQGGPAGDLVSNASDLLAFAVALQEHALLDEALTELFTSSKVEVFRRPDFVASYGYGFEIIDWHGVTSIGHSGEAAGESTLLRIYPDHGYVVIVLANRDVVAHEIGMKIHELVFAESAAAPR